MKIELVNKAKPHEFVVGDLFKTRHARHVRMIVLTRSVYQTITLGGIYQSHDTSIGLLMRQYSGAEFIGRLEIKVDK